MKKTTAQPETLTITHIVQRFLAPSTHSAPESYKKTSPSYPKIGVTQTDLSM